MSSSSFPPFAVARPPKSVSSACHNNPTVIPGPSDDAEIVSATRARLDSVYRLHGPKMLRYLRGRVGDDAAPDVMHEAIVQFANSRKVHQLAEPAAYLWRVLRNLVAYRARQARRNNVVLFPLDEGRDPPCHPEQELSLEAADLLRLYEEAVASLPEKTRRVFLMRRVDELSYREIHERVGISIATVEYHMARALVHITRAVDAGR